VKQGVLLIIDGWGFAPPAPDNAIALAATPTLDEIAARCPGTLASASGEAVGLLPGHVGNSEIGHMVIGAGRPLAYDSLLLQQEIDSGALLSNARFTGACSRLANRGSVLHLVGLASDGQIHSSVGHFGPLLEAAAMLGVRHARVHAITDGRDVADGTACGYLQQLERDSANAGIGTLATIVGRNYAMDKTGDHAVTASAMHAIADGVGRHREHYTDAFPAVRGDGWVEPTVLPDPDRRAVPIDDGDVVLFVNFRSDRTQQLADMLADQLFKGPRPRSVELLSVAHYDTVAQIPALVTRTDASGGLADGLEEHELASVRVAEREKYEHVTYYMNGRDNRKRPLEVHIRIDGSAHPDYRSQPQMNVARLANVVTRVARSREFPLVIANLSNIDVVAHAGDHQATVAATESVDGAIARICDAAGAAGRWVMLVGDHGNGERMTRPGPDGRSQPYGGHTANPVPLMFLPAPGSSAPRGPARATLADVAPSIMALLGCSPTRQMTGRPLFGAVNGSLTRAPSSRTPDEPPAGVLA